MRALRLIPLLFIFVLAAAYAVPPAHAASGGWTSSSSITLGGTVPDTSPVCVYYSGYAYCGISVSGPATSWFYAPFSSTGFGTWTSTTSYSLYTGYGGDNQCTVADAYIVCIAFVGTGPGTVGNAVAAYAPLSASGIGTWSMDADPNLAYQAVSGGSCFSAEISSTWYVSCASQSTADGNTYVATFSGASGFSAFATTTKYPDPYSQSCAVTGTNIYCVGGEVSSAPTANTWYATLSPSGVGTYVAGTAYPLPIRGATCVIFSSTLACAGGVTTGSVFTSDVYTAPISSAGIGTWTASTSYPSAASLSMISSGTDLGGIGPASSTGGVTPTYFTTAGTPQCPNGIVTKHYTAPISWNPDSITTWLIPVLFVFIPAALFLQIGEYAKLEGSKFMLFSIGALIGSLFGAMAGEVPAGFAVLFIVTLSLSLWRARRGISRPRASFVMLFMSFAVSAVMFMMAPHTVYAFDPCTKWVAQPATQTSVYYWIFPTIVIMVFGAVFSSMSAKVEEGIPGMFGRTISVSGGAAGKLSMFVLGMLVGAIVCVMMNIGPLWLVAMFGLIFGMIIWNARDD